MSTFKSDWKPGEQLTAAHVNDLAEQMNRLSVETIARETAKNDLPQFPCVMTGVSDSFIDNYSVVAILPGTDTTNPRVLKMTRPKKDQYDKLLFTNQSGRLSVGGAGSGYVTPIVPGGFYELKTETGVVVGDVTGPATDKYTVGKPSDAIIKPLLCVSPIRDGKAFYVGLGSAAATPCTNKWQLYVLWGPTGGSFKLRVRARANSTSAWVDEDVVIPWNASTTQVKTAIEGHSIVAANTVTVTASGAFPINNMTIIMPTNSQLGDGSVSAFEDSSNKLTNTSFVKPVLALWNCCT